MKIGLFLLTAVLLLSGCKRNEEKNCLNCKEKPIPLQIIKGTSFTDGAGCYFSSDTLALAKRAYIFVSDYNETAVINVEGEDIFLKQKNIDSEQIEHVGDTYENEIYEILVVTSEPYDSLDYTFYYTGSITFKNKVTGEHSVHTIYGVCGC